MRDRRSRSALRWLAGTFAVLVQTVCAQTVPVPAASADPSRALPRVLLIGDSISIGYTRGVKRRLDGIAEVTRIPCNGEWTGTGVANIDAWLGEGRWDVIHCNWGLWDLYGWKYASQDRSPEAYARRLDLLVRRMAPRCETLIWAMTTPACPAAEWTMQKQFGAEVVVTPTVERRYLDAAEAVMHRHGVRIDDLYARVRPDRDALLVAPDNVHFDKDGYELLAEQVAGVIARAVRGERYGRAARRPGSRHLFVLSGQSNMRPELVAAFRARVESVQGEGTACFAHFARPSQPIRMWDRDWRPPPDASLTAAQRDAFAKRPHGMLFDALLRNVREVRADAPLAGVTLVWMQGEADAIAGWSEVYADSFRRVCERLGKELGQADVSFVIGRINDHYVAREHAREGVEIRAVQVALAEAAAHGAWVDTDDLNTGVNPWGRREVDGGHLTVDGYTLLGQRMADAAMRLLAARDCGSWR